jgi:hypothetical protein
VTTMLIWFEKNVYAQSVQINFTLSINTNCLFRQIIPLDPTTIIWHGKMFYTYWMSTHLILYHHLMHITNFYKDLKRTAYNNNTTARWWQAIRFYCSCYLKWCKVMMYKLVMAADSIKFLYQCLWVLTNIILMAGV